MLRKFRVLICFALAALAWNVTPAYSTTLTTYTDSVSFGAATPGDTTINFQGLVGVYNTGTGLSVGNVDFIGYSNPYSLQVIDTSNYSLANGNFGTNEALVQQTTLGGGDILRVSFTTPVYALGSNLFTANINGMTFAITLYDASLTPLAAPLTVTTSATTPPTFWGVTSDTPISRADFTLQTGGSQAFLDNFAYNTSQSQPPPPPDVPEAATFLLIGSGLLGLAILGKKMRPAQFV